MDEEKTKTYFEIIGNVGIGESIALSQIIKEKEINKENVIVLCQSDFKNNEVLTERLKKLSEGTIIVIEDIDNIIKEEIPKVPSSGVFKIEALPKEVLRPIFVEEKPFSKFRKNINDFKGGRNRKLRRY